MSLASFRKLDKASITLGSLLSIKSLKRASFEVEIIPVTCQIAKKHTFAQNKNCRKLPMAKKYTLGQTKLTKACEFSVVMEYLSRLNLKWS